MAASAASPPSSSPMPPARPQTPMSRLPRCAVVNFRKDGSSLAWKPRLSQNVGGLAARVHNFEDAFSLEEFSSRALPTPQSLHLEQQRKQQQQQHFTSSLAAATKLNVNAPKSLKLPSTQPQQHAAYQRAHVQQRALHHRAQRQNVLRSSGGLRRSALSFFKRILQRDRRSGHPRAVHVHHHHHSAQHEQSHTVSYHQRAAGSGDQPLCTPSSTPSSTPAAAAHGGTLYRKLSDSTVTDESDQSGSPQMRQESAPAYADGRLRFEQKSKSVWRASRNSPPADAKRRVRSSLGGSALPSLRRRMHKHSEMGTSANGSDDPYVRFITSVM